MANWPPSFHRNHFLLAFPSSRSQWLSISFLGLAFVLLWLDLFSLPLVPVGPALDLSWCGALIHFSALKLQFGKEVIFTYGPLGHLISFVYTGELFTARVIWEYASKTLFAAILCATIVFLPRLWRLPFFFFVLLFIWLDPISDALYFLVISCVTALLFQHGVSRASLNALAGALFGACSLIKFTYFLLCAFAVVLLAISYLSRQRRAGAIALVASFIVCLLLCWKLAGQEYGNFPSFIATSLDVSFGYKDAMGLPAASGWIVAAGAAAALLGLALCALIFWNARNPPVLCLVLFYASEMFLSWNRAFVRADDHVLSFFALCPVALLTLWIAVRSPGIIKLTGYAVNLLIVLVCLTGISLQKPTAITHCLSDTISRLAATCRIASAPGSTAQRLRTQLIDAKAANALPLVRAAVGNENVDVFGYEQGTVLLNDLNYKPRPVFQGYSAYTPRLIAANTAFYSSPRAPAFVLLKYQPIDERYPDLEDAGVLRQLLFNYRPLFQERGYTLWKRISELKPNPPLLFATQSLVFDEVCLVPGGKNLWIELEVPPSFRGRLLDFFYKPPPVEIHVNDSQGGQTVHRLIPPMSSAGFILNPQLETERDLLQSGLGGAERSAISFLVHVPRESRRFFQRSIVCRLAALPDLSVEISDRPSRIARYTALFREDGPILELAAAFRSASDVLINAGPNGLDGFSALDGVELRATPGGLSIRAEGANPRVFLPKFTVPEGRRAILRIDLEATVDIGLQLFFLRAGESESGSHLMNRCASRRKNVVYFELGQAEAAGASLHLDPGDYLITHFEIRSIPALPEIAP